MISGPRAASLRSHSAMQLFVSGRCASRADSPRWSNSLFERAHKFTHRNSQFDKDLSIECAVDHFRFLYRGGKVDPPSERGADRRRMRAVWRAPAHGRSDGGSLRSGRLDSDLQPISTLARPGVPLRTTIPRSSPSEIRSGAESKQSFEEARSQAELGIEEALSFQCPIKNPPYSSLKLYPTHLET
jgi:hypothetical protein